MKQKEVSDSYIQLSELKDKINSIPDRRDQLLLRILYETGCDLIELTKIKVEDIQGNNIKIKDHKIRYPKISGKLAKDLKFYILGNNLKKESYLFNTRQSKSISEKRVRQLVKSYTKTNPHSFRYFHIIHAYLNGVYIENIANQLGITPYRVFQVISELNVKPQNMYNQFLNKLG